MGTTFKNPVVKVSAYRMDCRFIRHDSVVKYKERDGDWVRGLVKHVDRDSVKVLSAIGTQKSFSATYIGEGNVEILIEIY